LQLTVNKVVLMSLFKIENGYVTIELSPFQCATLARACHFASQQSLDEEIDTWRTLAALFQACTIAGFAQWHMSNHDLEVLFDQLARLGLGWDNSDEPKAGSNGHRR
jgi:hypothetical protein